MKLFIIIIGFLVISSCETSKQNEVSVQDKNETTQVLRVTKKDIEAIDFLDYGLSNPTKKAVANWPTYSELQSLVESIKSGDLSYFESDDEVIKVFIKDLKTGLPEKMTNQSINARLTALETKFYKLKSVIKITNTPKAELILTIKELFEAFSNLNLQMNKKLEKEAQDISKNNL